MCGIYENHFPCSVLLDFYTAWWKQNPNRGSNRCQRTGRLLEKREDGTLWQPQLAVWQVLPPRNGRQPVNICSVKHSPFVYTGFTPCWLQPSCCWPSNHANKGEGRPINPIQISSGEFFIKPLTYYAVKYLMARWRFTPPASIRLNSIIKSPLALSASPHSPGPLPGRSGSTSP